MRSLLIFFLVVALNVPGLLSAELVSPTDAAKAKVVKPQEIYRVAGIMIVSGKINLALIELPDGEQVMLRKGSELGDGEVIEITKNVVRIKFPGGESVLRLKGFDGPVEDQRPSLKATSVAKSATQIQTTTFVKSATSVVKNDIDPSEKNAFNRVVDINSLLNALDKKAPIAAKTEEESLTNYLAPLLDLPAKARIIGLNHDKFASAQEALNKIYDELAEGNVVSLTISKGTVDEQVYIMPEPSP